MVKERPSFDFEAIGEVAICCILDTFFFLKHEQSFAWVGSLNRHKLKIRT
jgi:hypothetical protein